MPVPGNGKFKTALIAVMAIAAGHGCGAALADEPTLSRAHYLGNEGVMVEHGMTKVLFDPLFRRDYGQYELVPPEIESALLAGTPPWDGIDAVFVSHYHEDHYDPALMLSYLRAHAAIELYAPAEAVEGLLQLVESADDNVIDRVHGIALEYGGAPIRTGMGGLLIEAVRIPHSGWPERRADVENIAFRVTLDGMTTVTHLGDADADVAHFEQNAAHWEQRRSHLALPPYWFFRLPERREFLIPRIRADHLVGVHVPKEIADEPSQRPIELQGVDLFTRPGEMRVIRLPDEGPK